MRTKILFFQPLVWIILFNGRNPIFQITQNLHLMNKPKKSKYASHKIAYILEGAIKEFGGFEAISLDTELRKFRKLYVCKKVASKAPKFFNCPF